MKLGGVELKDVKNKSIRQLVANFRNEYISNGIDEKTMSDDPIQQFEKWFSEALENKVLEPNAFHLSTCSEDGRPSGRVMLLKGFSDEGFIFFTNYDSRKGNDLKKNANASMTFLWLELYRQIRIEGSVSRIPAKDSDEYFHSRPRGSQVGAAVSAQSKALSGRDDLENAAQELEKNFSGREIPRPENWGGLLLKPIRIEFWQGRVNRLHDRILYEAADGGKWTRSRLYP